MLLLDLTALEILARRLDNHTSYSDGQNSPPPIVFELTNLGRFDLGTSLASIEGSVTDRQALLKESTVGSDFKPPGHPLYAHDVVSSGDRSLDFG